MVDRKPACTLLVLTYKGLTHLKHLLPTVRQAIKNTPDFVLEVLIVDNGRGETARQFVTENFPEFRYEFSKANDYLFSLNGFVEQLESEFVFILNDDMKLDNDILNQTLPFIQRDPELFAVTCNEMDWEGRHCTTGVCDLCYERGWVRKRWLKENLGYPRYTLYAGGGAAVFRTSLFNALGGFDYLFFPGYAEDLDLGHRAWHQGYKIVYNHAAIVYHRVGGTFRDHYGDDRLTQMIYCHLILWMVKDAKRAGFLIMFFLMLPYRLLTGWKTGRNSYFALWRALPRMPRALIKRMLQPKPVFSDKNIMALLGQKYAIH